jgi:hypothetical protein
MNLHKIILPALLGLVLSATVVPAAQADFGLDSLDAALSDPDGTPSRQAGAHPDLTFQAIFTTRNDSSLGAVVPDGNVKDVRVDLPPGLVGNPTAVATCMPQELRAPNTSVIKCPGASQVGVVRIAVDPDTASTAGFNDPNDQRFFTAGLYNMVHDDDIPAKFSFLYAGAIFNVIPRLRAEAGYAITADSINLPQAKPVFGFNITLWGIPADPQHNVYRTGLTNPSDPNSWGIGVGSPDARRPFLSAPTACSDQVQPTTVTMDPWEDPARSITNVITADFEGTPFLVQGCDRLTFSPSIDVQPLSHVADAPTGLDVQLTVPQNDSPDGLATPEVKRVKVVLPLGMSVSPSSATGLGACASSEIGLGSNAPDTCPDSSKIGTVEITTPLLSDPLEGDVVLAKQQDNPFGSLLALYITAPGPGFVLKLPGRIDADPVSGQLTATFDNTPQLPFSALHMHLRGGSNAPLANPTACGAYSAHTEIASWASDGQVASDSPMAIDEGCQARTFSPSLSAGSTVPVAGQDTSFNLTLTRPNQTQNLAGVSAVVPKGLLAHIGDVAECPEAQASAGTCDGASLVGHTSALSGPGAMPLSLGGNVYLTGPYKGAPFGLSIVVPTAGQAGPFDLGNVVVRAALSVDPIDVHATVVSDPLPTIIQGIPLRLRQVTVNMDRPGFIINPTNCTRSQVSTDLTSTEGAAATLAVPFSIGGCGGLGLAPKLALALTGKGQTTDDKHPGVSATLTQPAGQANLKKVQVALPLSLALDPDNAQGLCEFVDGSKVTPTCPKASIVGSASAVTPALNVPLSGPVYFVKNVRKDPKSGREIRTLPKLVIPLVGQNGVKLTLTGTSNVVGDRLVTTFDNIPDAPVSSFKLNIIGGKGGILVVSGADICKTTQIADQEVDGQNAKVVDSAVYIQTPACSLKVLSKKITKTSVTVKVAGLGAGKVTVTGKGIKKTTKTISKSTVATIVAKRTKGTPGKVTVSFDPTGPAKARKVSK